MNIPEQVECIRQAASRLYAEAKHLKEFTGIRIRELAGSEVGLYAYRQVFFGDQLRLLQREWLLKRIENAADEVFASGSAAREITFQQIASLVGCSTDTVRRLAGSQLRDRLQKALVDSQERLLLAIQRLVEAKIPLQEYSWKRIYAEAGYPLHLVRDELKQAFADGREALIQSHQHQQQQRIAGATYTCIQGDWVNLDEPVWYLACTKATLRRDRLRSDMVEIAWALLREEALMMEVAAGSLEGHYQDFLSVAKFLGKSIPDIRAITLEGVQQIWFASSLSFGKQGAIRAALERLLEKLLLQEIGAMDITPQNQEYARVLHWLQTIRVRRTIADKAYLSEAELDTVLDACLEDILRGLAYMQHLESGGEQLMAGMPMKQAESVLYWGFALLILVMAFTGLRRQSLLRLTTEDIARLGPQAYALTWQHGKPNKQRIAIIPALVAEHLQHYIRVTAPVRASLGTPCIFFARNHVGRWDILTDKRIETACNTFVRRHMLKRSHGPLHLGSTLLRRTYATRAMYTLPSVAALQAQLGHTDARTTLGYVQSDRFEHPSQVDSALDALGRKVLARWHTPLLLDDLPDSERQALLCVRVAHEQDVGMCRHDVCVKLDTGTLPPCSLCEHLVSGPEYAASWEQEKTFREQQLERLSRMSNAELLYAQMKGQYDRFLANYQVIQNRSHS